MKDSEKSSGEAEEGRENGRYAGMDLDNDRDTMMNEKWRRRLVGFKSRTNNLKAFTASTVAVCWRRTKGT